jgi:uncharacterized membrane protein
MRLMAARALAAAAILWSATIFAAAYAGARMHGVVPASLAAVVYGIGSVLCHQRPERSFHLWSVQLAVCARCTGIYVGAAGAALAGFASGASRTRTTSAARRVFPPLVVLILAATPALATLVYEWTTGAMPSNGIRAASGVVLGGAVMGVLLGEVRDGR